MKRRSPWLTFAACVLMRGSSAQAEPAVQPVLSISKASSAAEAELEKRGLAGDHVISSVVLVRAEGKPTHYSARIEPPVPAATVKGAADPLAGAEKTEGPSLAFKIEMNGTVSVTPEPPRRRIRVVNSISK